MATQETKAGKSPEEIALNRIERAKLKNETVLSLRSIRLKIIPPEISQLRHLTSLYLGWNQLSSLPPEIGFLSNLTLLELTGNKNIEFHPNLAKLTQLTHLYLGNCQLTSFPNVIINLTKLEYLLLALNNLTTLPGEIGKLIQLESLILYKNQLTELPAEIRSLSKLTTLKLSANKLTALPQEIQELENLQNIVLYDNPLGIPPEILKKYYSPKTIFNYYFSLVRETRKAINEAKLILVGQGNVGKTSICKRLTSNKFDSHEGKTCGIDIHGWQVQTTTNIPVRLHVWDFGGQEIMHATHQFFLTKRSLYLLVLDARLGQDENRVEYWLRMIQSFGGDSPVIVVGNKIDQQPLDIDRRGLQAKYPNIKAFVETSCLDGRGIDELKEVISKEVNNLPHVRDELPESWFQVKEKLEEMEKDFIPYSEYEALCNDDGITDEISQSTLIGFLHDLGSVLNFRDDPRLQETNILNPEWVTNGVYRILNSNELFQKKGVLETKQLGQMLDPKAYPKSRHMFIVDMMRKFELCYPFEGDDGKYLVPDLLPREEPFTGDWADALAFEFHYTVLPSSIISRFIVRMHPYIYQNLVWRSGVVLLYEGNQIKVRADYEDKKIFIDITGPDNTRRDALSAIRGQMDSIHKTIPGLRVEQKVPLPDHPEAEPVDYEFLRRMDNEGRESLPVKAGNNIIDVIVKEVLNRIEDKSKRVEVHIHGNVTDTQFIVGDDNQQTASK